MSRGLTQPITQVRLTNVAVVRLSRAGKRFEIACYRNKVVNWRNKLETDIDEVLQIDSIFQNVSKGVLAKKKDIVEAFGTDDETAVCKMILERGEMQVSDKERQAHMESLFRDIATIVSDKCVDPTSNRPYTVGMIQSAMRDVHYAVVPTRGAKQQALDVIRQLAANGMPIARARMRLRVVATAEDFDRGRIIRAELEALGVDCGSGSDSGSGVDPNLPPPPPSPAALAAAAAEEWRLDILVDPGLFRAVEELVREKTGGRGQVQVLQLAVQEEGEADMDAELARKDLMALKLREEKEKNTLKGKLASTSAGPAGDGEDDSNGGEDNAVASAVKGAAAAAVGGKAGGNGGGGGKKSKKAKRREKEAAEERALAVAEATRRQDDRRRQRQATLEAGSGQLEGGGPAAAAAAAPNGSLSQGGEAKYGMAATEGEGLSSSSAAAFASTSGLGGSSKLRCSTCGVHFEEPKAHREHHKSDWHRYNLKMKLKGIAAVSEEEFSQVDADALFLAKA